MSRANLTTRRGEKLCTGVAIACIVIVSFSGGIWILFLQWSRWGVDARISAPVSAVPTVQKEKSVDRSFCCIKEIHTNWTVRRNNSYSWKVRRLPITALAAYLEDGRFATSSGKPMHMKDLYRSTNLRDLPDISRVGRDFYTLTYEYYIAPLDPNEAACHSTPYSKERFQTTTPTEDLVITTRQILRIAGINYHARAWLDGVALPEIGVDNSSTSHPGMFRRRNFDVTNGGLFAIQIFPPYHPGVPVVNSQGGDHALAQDGATAQYNLGWDWCQPMPDRATGFYGSVTLEKAGPIAIMSPAVQTVSIEPGRVRLRFLAGFESQGTISSAVRLRVSADWGDSWDLRPTSILSDFSTIVTIRENIHNVKLWWPHGMGIEKEAQLHTFTFSVFINDNLSDQKQIPVGVRTIETFVDQKTKGQVFLINGRAVYLVGGNWIATDQALRYSASLRRYCHEIALHKYAGINLLRVWGGGTAERDQFYTCADRLGILVYQEMWMTGDNNGRWAGDYSWPLDYGAYLSNVEDTVKRLRNRPSLLFYSGCNECLAPNESRWAPNPPSEINDGIRDILGSFDPDRFYIPSSMGGANKADTFSNPSAWEDRSYSLAFSDGPYGMLLPTAFFERNPGLPQKVLKIGFQPEIGSVGAPSYEGLLRFLTKEEIEAGFPQRCSSNSGDDSWVFHKYLPWTTTLPNNEVYDHVYTYFQHDYIVNASEWVAAAQLAAHLQYESLFNGFVSHCFEYTTAVIMWKTQSPWPSLRGFLYDWYLEATGALYGVRASIYEPVSIIFDPSDWTVRLLDRRSDKHTFYGNASMDWVDLSGKLVASDSFSLLENRVSIDWPKECSSVCYLRLGHNITGEPKTRWHWLTSPSTYVSGPDFSQLGEIRRLQSAKVYLEVISCSTYKERSVHIEVAIHVSSDSPTALFYPTFTLKRNVHNKPLFPLYDHNSTDLVILPAGSQVRMLVVPYQRYPSMNFHLEMKSWNAPDITVKTTCILTESETK